LVLSAPALVVWSIEGRKPWGSSFVFQDEVHEAWIESGYLSG
jgi:hypothetical protein